MEFVKDYLPVVISIFSFVVAIFIPIRIMHYQRYTNLSEIYMSFDFAHAFQSVITFFVVTFSKPSLFYLLCSRRAYSFLRLPPVWIERSRISAISSNITLFHSPNVPSFIFLRVYLTLCDNRVAYPETDDASRYTLEAHHKRL